MGKVIKILISVLSYAVLCIIILPLMLALLLSVPSVQNFAVQYVAKFASEKWDLNLSVDKIAVKGYNKLSLNGLYVEDLRGDTLLYIPHLKANLNKAGLFRGEVLLGGIDIDSAQINLYRPLGEAVNAGALVRHIKDVSGGKKEKRNKHSGLKLSDISLTNARFKYFDERCTENPTGGINFRDISFEALSLSSREMNFLGDSVAMELHDLSFTDRSGYGIDLLNADIFAFRKGSLYFRDAKILSGESELNMPRLELLGNTWKSYRYFADSMRVVAEIADSRIDMHTAGAFVRSLDPVRELSVSGLSLNVNGRLNDFHGSLQSATINGDTYAAGDFKVRSLKDKARLYMNVENLDVRSDLRSAEQIYAELKGGQFDMKPKLRERLLQMGRLRVTGHALKRGGDMDLSARLTGDAGFVSVDGTMTPDAEGTEHFTADVGVHGFNVGKLAGNRALGAATMIASVNGTVADGEVKAYLTSTVESIGLGGRTYADIDMHAWYDVGDVTLSLSSPDPKAVLTLSGGYGLNDSQTPRYDFRLNARQVLLGGDNAPDSVAWLSCTLDGNATGRSLDDMNGRVNINDIVYRTGADTLSLGALRVVMHDDGAERSASLGSDFLDVKYSSDMGYRESFRDVKSLALRYFPALANGTTEHATAPAGHLAQGEAESGSVELQAKVKAADRVLRIFSDNVSIAPGTELKLTTGTAHSREFLSLDVPYVDCGGVFIDELGLTLADVSDTLHMSLRTRDVIASGLDMPYLRVDGTAAADRFSVAAGYDNEPDNNHARLNLRGGLTRHDGKVAVGTEILPSYLDINGRQWDILCNALQYSKERLSLDELLVHNGRHEIMADGVLSANDADTLSVLLRDVNLDVVNPFIGHLGYDVSGTVNGYADIMALRNGIRMDAEATLDSVRINQYELDPLKFESQWNTGSQRVIFTLKNMLSDKTLLKSYLRSGDKAFLTDIRMGQLPLGALSPLLGGAVEDVDGMADVALELRNDTGALRINGNVDIEGLQASVPFTSTSYRADRMRLNVKNSMVDVEPVKIRDEAGHSAELSAQMDMHTPSELKYEVKLLPDNLLVLNTSSAGSGAFYGTLSVSGAVDIKGDRQGTDIDGALTTGANSVLNVAVGGASDFSIADYVTFEPEERPVVQDTLNDASVRHREYQERVENGLRKAGTDIGMNITVTPDLTFKLLIDQSHDNVLTANGNATLAMNVRPRDDIFTIYGMYELTSGNYNFNIQNLIDKKFTLGSGSSILWTGDPLDATLDISASYRLKTSIASLLGTEARSGNTTTNVDCVVNITDKLSSPQFSFDVQLPNADSEYQSLISSSFSTQEMMATQFFYLLAFGTLYSDTNYAENLNVGANAGTSLGFDFLSSQIRNILSVEDLSFNLRYTPKSTVNSDEYGFYFQSDLINNKLVLELEGNYDTGNNPTSSTNMVSGGGTLTYYIDNSGNLVLKGYSRTIDRFDENQGLQENGVGIYFKEDFNNMNDLLSRLRARFLGKRKRQGTD